MKKRQMMTEAVLAALLTGCFSSPFDEFRGWEKNLVVESVDIGAFENGSFEDGAAYGKVKDNKQGEIGRYGVNGGGGLKISDIDHSSGYVLKLKAPLKKGVRYVFSADVRVHGKAFGRLAMDGYFRKPREVAPGCSAWHTNYGPYDAQGWRHETVEVVPKYGSDQVDFNFMIYNGLEVGGKPGPENYVEVDNVKIESAAPKWYFCNVWPTQNQIYADEGRIRINSSFYGDFFTEGAKPVYACRLVTDAGETLGERVAEADAWGNFTLDFGKLEGRLKEKGERRTCRLEATLYDRATRQERGSRSLDLTLCIPDRNTRLFVKENGVVLKDGKPFMPLGFYTGLADKRYHDLKDVEYHLKRLHDAGFDATMDYHSYELNGKYRDDFYALYDKYGMWMLADDFKVGMNDPKFDEKFVKQYRPRAKDLAKYPCIIGLYTMDENPEEAVPRLTRLRRMINEELPGRMVNICNINRPEPYLPVCDIPGGDNYPIVPSKYSELYETHRRLSTMQHASAPAPIWWAPQCYNAATMKCHIMGNGARTNAVIYRKVGREPTHEENLSVALCTVGEGAKGFFFYSYFDILQCPVPEYREHRWNSMCEIAKVLRRLEPFIMSGEKIVDVPHADAKDETTVKALSDGKGRYRVIVCGLRKQHETTFRLPPEYGNLKPLLGNAKFENGQWVFRGKDFSCDLFE